MKKFFRRFIILLVISIAAALGYLYMKPDDILNRYYHKMLVDAGLEKASVDIKVNNIDYTIHYAGKNPAQSSLTIVMLHAFGRSKADYYALAASLPDDARLIIPDLPAHGDNAKDAALDYSLAGQTAMMAAFTEALGLTDFVLAGNSLGGQIAAELALDNTKKISHLILINAPLLNTSKHYVYRDLVRKTDLVRDLDLILAKYYYQVPAIPTPLAMKIMENYNAVYELKHDIILPALAESYSRQSSAKTEVALKTLKKPVLIVWGEDDTVALKIIGRKLEEIIAGSQLIEYEKARHAPQLDYPQKLAEDILSFISR